MLDYWAERLPLRVFAPLAVALACPAQARHSWTAWALAQDVLFALLLLAQFRLWDDLADRSADAREHPHRVLVRSGRLQKYVAVCMTLAVANAGVVALRDGSAIALPLLIVLNAFLAIEYLRRRSRSAGSDLARLAKYPAFVVIIAAGRPDALASGVCVGAASAYLAACAYEVWHDPATPLRLLIRSTR